LNKRIEELENHKKSLQDKLRKHETKPDLDYLLESQGIKNLEAKKLDKVNVENYNPEAMKRES
jgi:hypothetical protein